MDKVAETTQIILNGKPLNLIIIGIIILTALIVGIVLVATKTIKFKGNKLSIGYNDTTREIIRRQIEYANNICQNFVDKILPQKNLDENNFYKHKYLGEKIYDEVVNWIAINHLSNDEFYVLNKQLIVWNIIQGVLEEIIDSELKKTSDEMVEKIIKQLIKIREYYSKEK